MSYSGINTSPQVPTQASAAVQPALAYLASVDTSRLQGN